MLYWQELQGYSVKHSEAPLDHMATIITEEGCLKHCAMIYGVLISCDISYRCYFIL